VTLHQKFDLSASFRIPDTILNAGEPREFRKTQIPGGHA